MRVCVVKNNYLTLTETFIQVHVAGLGAEVIHGQPPRLVGRGGRRAPAALRLAGRVFRRVSGPSGRQRGLTLEYASLLRATRADVVLAEYGTTGAAMWRACEAEDLPLVVHFHGYDASRTAVLERYADEYREMFDYASAVVVVSRAMRDRVVGLGAPAEKVVLNPCSVDLGAFSAGAPDQAPPTFLAVGRLVEKKAPHLLVLAFADVRRKVPEARLRIVGEGELMGVVADLVTGLGLGEAVDLLGAQPHEVVRQEMQRARAFVQHSVVAADGDSEGTPVSVLEAAASGLPVVSTSHAGIPDAVADGQTGFIVAERDVPGMAARMLDLARDPDLAARLGAAGRERVSALYGQALRMSRLRDVLQRAHDRVPMGDDLLWDPLEAFSLSRD